MTGHTAETCARLGCHDGRFLSRHHVCQCSAVEDMEAERDFIATRLCTTHQGTSPTRIPCAACTGEVDSLVAEVRREAAERIVGACKHPVGQVAKTAGLSCCVRCSQAARVAREETSGG